MCLEAGKWTLLPASYCKAAAGNSVALLFKTACLLTRRRSDIVQHMAFVLNIADKLKATKTYPLDVQ